MKWFFFHTTNIQQNSDSTFAWLCWTFAIFALNFNDYLSLTKTLKEIGEITHQYFILVKEYDIYLQTQNVNIDKRREMLVQYNEKILNHVKSGRMIPPLICYLLQIKLFKNKNYIYVGGAK